MRICFVRFCEALERSELNKSRKICSARSFTKISPSFRTASARSGISSLPRTSNAPTVGMSKRILRGSYNVLCFQRSDCPQRTIPVPIMSQERTVFVIMPFSATRTATAEQWTETFEHIFRPAIEFAGFICRRAQVSTGSLITSIIEDLRTARILLADITDQNPNVFYELGVRHALSKRTIIVSQRYEDVPSDLRGYWTIIYGRGPGDVSRFRTEFKSLIDSIEDNPEKSDNPVSDVLDKYNLNLSNVVNKENVKKLTALNTEISGNIVALKRLSDDDKRQYVFLSTSCLDLLLATLYVDPGDYELKNAYETMYGLRLILKDLGNQTVSDVSVLVKIISGLRELAKCVLFIRESLIRGIYEEQRSISTLVWDEYNIYAKDPQTAAGLDELTHRIRRVFPMYCRLEGIAGADGEQRVAESMLGASEALGKRVVILPMGSHGWIYGQCSFKRSNDDEGTLKFTDTITSVTRQNIFNRLVESNGLHAILLDKRLASAELLDLLRDAKLISMAYYCDGLSIERIAQSG